MLAAELDGVICSGALRGKQHTYALLDDRVPPSPIMDRGDALAELAGRYYSSHGPATVKDFALVVRPLRCRRHHRGTRTAQPALQSQVVDGRTLWFAPAATAVADRASLTAHLLPNFDEYTVGYADRTDLVHAHDAKHLQARPDVIGNNVIVIDGRVAGTWRRTPAEGSGRDLALALPTAEQAGEQCRRGGSAAIRGVRPAVTPTRTSRPRIRCPQRRQVDDEAIAHIAAQGSLEGLVHLLDGNSLDVRRDAALGAEVEHLLGLADAADHRARETAPLVDERARLEHRRVGAGQPAPWCRRVAAGAGSAL